MFSNVICIGDSYTNEHECYEAMGYDKKFIELDYEFKSYPQILGEYYDCKWETFGKPGMPMPYSCLLYTSPSPRDRTRSRMPSSA